MRPTVPDFVPLRLEEAREVRGLTQTILADLLGVSRQAVSQYESGASAPSRSVLSRVSERLYFPEHRFIRPISKGAEPVGHFRSLASATKAARQRAKHRCSWLRNDVLPHLQRWIVLPDVRFPKFDVPDDPVRLDNDDIERLAIETRRAWGLGDGPISDLVLLLENNGAVVVRQELGANTLDAYSEVSPEDDRPFIVLGTEKASAARSRFDAGHELGHVVLHPRVPKSRANRSGVFRLMELQAHFFATSFLLPRESFGDEWSPHIDALITLKSRWRVSVAAMIHRAHNLGLVSDAQSQRLHANLARRFGRRWEPMDDDLVSESPRLIRRAFDVLLDKGLTSAEHLRDEIALNMEDVEASAGLEPGFFGESVQHMKFPALRDPNGLPQDKHTPMLPFKPTIST